MSRFDRLEEKVAAEYRAKGYSDEEALAIGKETAGKVYRERVKEGKE